MVRKKKKLFYASHSTVSPARKALCDDVLFNERHIFERAGTGLSRLCGQIFTESPACHVLYTAILRVLLRIKPDVYAAGIDEEGILEEEEALQFVKKKTWHCFRQQTYGEFLCALVIGGCKAMEADALQKYLQVLKQISSINATGTKVVERVDSWDMGGCSKSCQELTCGFLEDRLKIVSNFSSWKTSWISRDFGTVKVIQGKRQYYGSTTVSSQQRGKYRLNVEPILKSLKSLQKSFSAPEEVCRLILAAVVLPKVKSVAVEQSVVSNQLISEAERLQILALPVLNETFDYSQEAAQREQAELLTALSWRSRSN
jgi:hypothetical protein